MNNRKTERTDSISLRMCALRKSSKEQFYPQFTPPVSSMQAKRTSKRKYQFGTTCIRKEERNLQGHVVSESDVRADKREF